MYEQIYPYLNAMFSENNFQYEFPEFRKGLNFHSFWSH